ncbi:MAG: hypothetical protein QXT63_09095, partial [Thermoplasmata archaeon]
MSEYSAGIISAWTSVITVFVLSLLIVSSMPYISGDRTISGTPFPAGGNGDWTINTDTVVENENLLLKGNLTITSTGSLTLRSSTLVIDQAASVEYALRTSGQISLENSVLYVRSF